MVSISSGQISRCLAKVINGANLNVISLQEGFCHSVVTVRRSPSEGGVAVNIFRISIKVISIQQHVNNTKVSVEGSPRQGRLTVDVLSVEVNVAPFDKQLQSIFVPVLSGKGERSLAIVVCE